MAAAPGSAARILKLDELVGRVGYWTVSQALTWQFAAMVAQGNLGWIWAQLDNGLPAPGWRSARHGEEQLLQRLEDLSTWSRRDQGAWEEVPPVLFPAARPEGP